MSGKNTMSIYDLTKKPIAWIDLTTYCNAGCPQCHRTNPNGLGKVDWLPLVQWKLEEFKQAWPVESLNTISKFEICGTWGCLLYTSPSPRDGLLSRMPSSA